MSSVLWPARLHHLRRDSPQPERLARFYGDLLGDAVDLLGDDLWLVHGRERALVVGKGAAGSVPYFALQVQDAQQLAAYARELDQRGVPRESCAAPLLGNEAFALQDPDGRRMILGLSKARFPGQGLPGRLQHFVCASSRL